MKNFSVICRSAVLLIAVIAASCFLTVGIASSHDMAAMNGAMEMEGKTMAPAGWAVTCR